MIFNNNLNLTPSLYHIPCIASHYHISLNIKPPFQYRNPVNFHVKHLYTRVIAPYTKIGYIDLRPLRDSITVNTTPGVSVNFGTF